ncbi:PLP-dependent aminotransferase family protein [Pseudorhodoferax sp. Leaf267]|uniref:MocR-like pyridoxine biosynthesis transcription factor PdxR n=1 Tax=Pseudorhodoferax sp. Leaf267 TaxID=1736316 RepID=UPI0006FE2760|nr:PLP-dependent aminotransferase family protein [Pseudorhodoferax sp. Leaf267]KQP18342.1 DNA-binding protein [Pseudorhodoferax sp. Leaf267]
MEPIFPHEASGLPDFMLQQFEHGTGEYNHLQLYRILQAGIRQSTLPAGLKLPPTREMAQVLGIARNTVVQVYEQLVLEGLAQAGVGRGTYVKAMAPGFIGRARAAPARRANALSHRGDDLVQGARASPLQWGAFAPGVPEVRMFPAKVWSRLQAQAWREVEPAHLSYATGAGHPDAREAIAEYLQGTRGVVCSAEQVVITNGTQQALHLVAQLLADSGDTVWLEDPGYWGARSIFRNAGLVLQPVPLDAEGMAPTAQQQLSPPRLMFLSPSHQYPTGVLMSHGRRRQLLDYAARHHTWIVEDDYDSEFRFAARPLPALQGLDEQGRVLYLGTFSKTLFPSMRLAYLVLPRDLVDHFSRALNELFREGQTLQQVVLARFMREGHYARHIRRMRGVYAARRGALIEAIGQRLGQQLPVLGSDAGLHLVLGLPAELDDDAVAREALAAGVMTRPLSLYSLRKPVPARGLVLGYGAVTEQEVRASFDRLAQVLERFLR